MKDHIKRHIEVNRWLGIKGSDDKTGFPGCVLCKEEIEKKGE